jgi:hypothetical protein
VTAYEQMHKPAEGRRSDLASTSDFASPYELGQDYLVVVADRKKLDGIDNSVQAVRFDVRVAVYASSWVPESEPRLG